MGTTSIRIPATDLSPKDCETVFNFVRRSVYKTTKEIKLIGMRIVDKRYNSGKGAIVLSSMFSTFPGSTDLVMDLGVKLAVENYTASEDLEQALTLKMSKNNIKVTDVSNISFAGSSKNDLGLIKDSNIAIASTTITKVFKSGETALTYRDFDKVMHFTNVDLDEPIVNITDPLAVIEMVLAFQEINGIQSELQNSMNCDYVFGEYINLPLSASCLTGISITFELDEDASIRRNNYIVVTGDEGDPRIKKLGEVIKVKLAEATRLYKN